MDHTYSVIRVKNIIRLKCNFESTLAKEPISIRQIFQPFMCHQHG